MKSSKFIIGTSAFVLAIGGFFVSKANKKFAKPTSAVVYNGSVSIASMSSFTNGFNTVSTGRAKVQLFSTASATPLGTVKTAASAGSKIVYHD
jgi:hypothetical protein